MIVSVAPPSLNKWMGKVSVDDLCSPKCVVRKAFFASCRLGTPSSIWTGLAHAWGRNGVVL